MISIQKPIELTTQQHNLIIGSMLGDGHLRRSKSTHNTALYIKRALKDYDYLEWESKICSNLLTNAKITKRERFDKRTEKTYYSCNFITKSLNELNSYYDSWYKNKIKVIPNDLKLNAEIIGIWFCDDGCISSTSSKRFRISFATNSFSKDEVYFLRDLLNARYNENFIIYKYKTVEQYIISGADSASRALICDIDPVFPEGMDRKKKWGIEFFEEAPKKYKSYQLSAQEKKKQIIEFINSHSEFRLVELAQYMNWSFTRGNGVIEWDTQNCKRYLKEYIKNKILLEFRSKEYRGGLSYKRLSFIGN